MHANSKIFVAGHRGMVGSALMRRLAPGFHNVVTRARTELDLTDRDAVLRFFDVEKPEYVFVAAAKVGGILANDMYPADFIRENLMIELNTIEAAWRQGVKRLLFLGSSCVYPRECPQPIREEYLMTGPLEGTNRAYATAKISGIEMCASYNRQYGTRFIAAMPTNLYGPNDNYDLSGAHVLPALIRKFHEAKERGDSSVQVWGTGTPRREFLYSDDVADACVFLMNLPDPQFESLTGETYPLINVGMGTDVSIEELTELVRKTVGFSGDIVWDHSKPDGTPRKLLDISRMAQLGWRARIGLEQGIQMSYRDFRAGKVRG